MFEAPIAEVVVLNNVVTTSVEQETQAPTRPARNGNTCVAL